MPVIATASLSKRYPRVTALDELTVEVGSGVTGLVGANGAGKSTLLKILLGLIAPTAGSAIVLGHDVVTGGGQPTGPPSPGAHRRCGPSLTPSEARVLLTDPLGIKSK